MLVRKFNIKSKEYYNGNVKEFLHWQSVRMWDGEVVFILKSIVRQESAKDMG